MKVTPRLKLLTFININLLRTILRRKLSERLYRVQKITEKQKIYTINGVHTRIEKNLRTNTDMHLLALGLKLSSEEY